MGLILAGYQSLTTGDSERDRNNILASFKTPVLPYLNSLLFPSLSLQQSEC